ncbi:nucleoside 2-deoxyribosyltransferase [Agrobacterium sp. SHOUNA12C]|uniref:Nucleoside 2-deoxyribosyltransferase protein n=2 Tax=Rhizobium rhizogenes TaxID=359 RepID=B9JMH0_RHIR8|nr:nucleoside 2-deoxyribosyltransferase [Rhizobium rhizogenes]ACM28558.1 nucleoside 2-deoxyribosyltransferase protein [Rhizobium rhizogenes K84]KAA6487984.1 nucleoside 2-deoxyribosyltransferase [Agrobacterium sp. ICMP 7243]MCJ9723981.1 nucleoside 2-deoxyribosyltransferase [Agrobacterium sp. BETTINA12B]MCJ9759602.1 nucleoside 2-deoxyribosyltransferase [Agrobacterium sp. SHOUNA12C]OCJ22266.1 nucleoside 2-deoxyribosyltransferase [Agrobacterium sp. B131/95]
MRAYLAGPEVFLPNAREILDRKIALARSYGFTPVSPGDLVVPETETKRQRGLAISAINESLMLSADLIIANLTPFRGVAADVGTAFELGFMCARGCPAFAFSNSTKSHFERVSRFYGGSIHLGDDGRYRGTDGMSLENFDMVDNLMLDGGIESRSGTIITREVEPDRLFLDLTAFEECLQVAADRLLAGAVHAEQSA